MLVWKEAPGDLDILVLEIFQDKRIEASPLCEVKCENIEFAYSDPLDTSYSVVGGHLCAGYPHMLQVVISKSCPTAVNWK